MARYGGGAVLGSMFGLNLLAREERFHLRLAGPAGRRRRVIILGGGMAGLSAAYELGRLGYDCTVLEARTRPGGRNWTVRRGTEETELGNPRQVCAFADGHFLNAGPMRISHHHTTTLGYCREFGIPLTMFSNFNEAAYIVRRGHPKLRIREVLADLSGHTSELLAKVVRRGELDQELTAEDRERFIEYLRGEGRLNADLVYARSGDNSDTPTHLEHSRGYTNSPGALGGPGEPTTPLELEALVKAGYGQSLDFLKDYHQQPTMLTPVGGMDRIAYGFAERLDGVVRYQCEVKDIRRTADGGVRIGYTDAARDGARQEIEGDFCICTLPPTLLRRLPADFSAPTVAALNAPQAALSGKIGLQFKRRFWEEDDDIYSGSSKTDDPIGQVYYPFDRFGAAGPGVLVGYYHFGGARELLDDRTPAERERVALEQGARIHPQYPAEFENSFSVAWHRVAYNEAPWMRWESAASFEAAQQVLRVADGPFYFAGDWTSNLNGWQAGAFVAAHRACALLHARSQTT
ncbi:Flavin-dependent L-tryptophan oxidase RebO precursor [Lacunisphaera limnophila]|uniref:Tryptophan 2-monooxygenase n=1 Tax=Lacunisphaera limnophila TaxID=1838286 RepID=A0A1D8ASW4_9BACT|nr:flavin monoamine oxidase family protein [Lacunisphaera limnophila]AOS43950.1 Flavin-dependent L-tryptophan oxidase RebO precursor [Lacunisphaera limnophila]